MTWDEMETQLREAEYTLQILDRHVAWMAKMCAGRLRSARSAVTATTLRELKRELQQFDARTGEWK